MGTHDDAPDRASRPGGGTRDGGAAGPGAAGRGNRTTRDLPARRGPAARGASGADVPSATGRDHADPFADDDPFGMHLIGDERRHGGEAENAYMSVRAYDAAGALLDMWAGPSFFHGAPPATYAAKRQRGRWRWTFDGKPTRDGERLKLDSDVAGSRGVRVGDWAPADAVHLTVGFHGLVAPFGNGPIQVDDRSPLSIPGELTPTTADGAEPVDPDAPGRLRGPLATNATASSGDLEVTQLADAAFFRVGNSTLHVANGSERDVCIWEIEPQTSRDQRVVSLQTTPGVIVTLANDPASPQIVFHRRTVPDPSLLPTSGGDSVLRGPGSITAVGDPYRVLLQLDNTNIHIQCLDPETRFAYHVAPEWSGEHGEERVVHIVATPGVKVDEWRLRAPDGSKPGGGDRRLVPNTIYVQDPELVPRQGTPIDPAGLLHTERRVYGKAEDGRRLGTAVTTGNAGVTVRDNKYGATITIEPTDPSVGARFAWQLVHPEDEGQNGGSVEFRALVGPGVFVHVHEVNRGLPTDDMPGPYDDFGINVDLRQIDDVSKIPAQGEPLSRAFLSQFPSRRPDTQTFPDQGTAWNAAHAVSEAVKSNPELGPDAAIGAVPVLGELVDLAEASIGYDKWGRKLSPSERIVIAAAVLLPFVAGAALVGGTKLVRGARRMSHAAREVEAIAEASGKSIDEMQAILARLDRLPAETRAEIRRVKHAIDNGLPVGAAELERLSDAFDGVGLGRMPRADGPIELAPGPRVAVEAGDPRLGAGAVTPSGERPPPLREPPPGTPRGECFVAGTLVWTPRGTVPIESLAVGDQVHSAFVERGVLCPVVASVKRVFCRQVAHVVRLDFGTAAVVCSLEHPFFVAERGWVAAGALDASAHILSQDGCSAVLASSSEATGRFDVYNIEVDAAHDYFVTALGLLVHNKPMAAATPRSNDLHRRAVDLPADIEGRDALVDEAKRLMEEAVAAERAGNHLDDGFHSRLSVLAERIELAELPGAARALVRRVKTLGHRAGSLPMTEEARWGAIGEVRQLEEDVETLASLVGRHPTEHELVVQYEEAQRRYASLDRRVAELAPVVEASVWGDRLARARWTDHGGKHLAAATDEEARMLSTPTDVNPDPPSQYLPGTDNARVEREALAKGKVIRGDINVVGGTVHVKYDAGVVVGYDRGMPVSTVRAEITAGDVFHGHPRRFEGEP